jgi:flagellar basal-body rod modification protein FlgD
MTTTSGVTGSTGTTATTTSTAGTAVKDRTAIDKDTFLKLLVAQMKYQDPSNPTDPSQFMSQTAQFTTVEKLTNLADLSQKVYDSSRQATATSMIGRTVTWKDVSGNAQSGLVTGVSVGAQTPNLTVGGVKVSLDDVSTVDTPAATAPAAATPAATT